MGAHFFVGDDSKEGMPCAVCGKDFVNGTHYAKRSAVPVASDILENAKELTQRYGAVLTSEQEELTETLVACPGAGATHTETHLLRCDECDPLDTCGNPCAEREACSECRSYWDRMIREGRWDSQRGWTGKGWRL